jgi:hypothetical protein
MVYKHCACSCGHGYLRKDLHREEDTDIARIFYLNHSTIYIQMLKTRVDHNIILIQTMLKNAAVMKNFLDYVEREYNWRIFTFSIEITGDKIC